MLNETLALLLALSTPFFPLTPRASAGPQAGGPSDPVMIFNCGESDWFEARGWRLILCGQTTGPDIVAAYQAFEGYLADRVECPACPGAPQGASECRAFADSGASVLVQDLGGGCFAYLFDPDVHLAGCEPCPN